MKLHLDRTAFLVLIDNIHKRTGYREDVLEKDYYVTLILKELADKQANGLPAYFKGVTALYKALKTTNRFFCGAATTIQRPADSCPLT